MPWNQHRGILIIITVLILQSCPSFINHRRRQRQDLWLDTGHWTLASHQTTSQTQQQLTPQQYNYDQAAAVTRAEPAFGKKFSQFFSTSAWAPYQSRHSPLSILHQKHIHCTLNHQPPENYATWRNFIFFLWSDPDFVDLWQPHP